MIFDHVIIHPHWYILLENSPSSKFSATFQIEYEKAKFLFFFGFYSFLIFLSYEFLFFPTSSVLYLVCPPINPLGRSLSTEDDYRWEIFVTLYKWNFHQFSLSKRWVMLSQTLARQMKMLAVLKIESSRKKQRWGIQYIHTRVDWTSVQSLKGFKTKSYITKYDRYYIKIHKPVNNSQVVWLDKYCIVLMNLWWCSTGHSIWQDIVILYDNYIKRHLSDKPAAPLLVLFTNEQMC